MRFLEIKVTKDFYSHFKDTLIVLCYLTINNYYYLSI